MTRDEYTQLGATAALLAATAGGAMTTDQDTIKERLDAHYFRVPGPAEGRALDQGINDAVFQVFRLPSADAESIKALVNRVTRGTAD
ncbi:MAG TPA: hypothetical protein VGT60_12690 [Candidatus Limnocylindria bacterium]|nr:hypothetical protein [Candidatus Limnocylindria bacterium]